MGVDMELEFEKYCTVGRSLRTVQPSPRSSLKLEKKIKKEDPGSSNDGLFLGEGFTEIRFRKYRSVSCKTLPSRNVEVEAKELLKRGSVYESSKERKLKRSEFVKGRKKIEFSVSGDSSFSFSILDSICGSDEKEGEPVEEKRSSGVRYPPLSTSGSAKFSKLSFQDCLDPLLHVPEDRSVSFDNRENDSAKYAERDKMENRKFKSDQVVAPSNNANVLRERDSLALNKSLSAKLTLPRSPAHTESEFSRGTPKPRFSPFRRMFDPLTKSKSHRSPSSSSGDHNEMRPSRWTSIGRNSKTVRKSLLQDFSSAAQHLESVCPSMKKEQQLQTVVSQCSPAHLHGNLKLEQKHGVPYYEFSLAHLEYVFVAKTWKAEDAHNWVYTFHCIQGRKKSNAGGWGSKCSSKDSPMVAQMQVSCFLCSDLKDGGEFSDSMVTEFVLYDISHARKGVASEQEFNSDAKVLNPAKEALAAGTIELDNLFNPNMLKSPVTSSIDHDDSDFSAPYPLAPTDLHPSLEIAAVVVQVPFHKSESLKCRGRNTIDDQTHSNSLDLSLAEKTKIGISHGIGTVKVNVVTPLGHHGLPTTESKGPLPLLDRWRLGRGCDCGGWDMACPLVVFSNHSTQCEQQHFLLDTEQQPFELSVQGAKDKTPAFSIAMTKKGHYSVDFHAQLSSLQAFAICVAILHATESSTSIEEDRMKHLLQSSSLKVLVEDEVKVLIEADTEEEKRKVRKAAEENPPSFMLNPPFSPIARV